MKSLRRATEKESTEMDGAVEERSRSRRLLRSMKFNLFRQSSKLDTDKQTTHKKKNEEDMKEKPLDVDNSSSHHHHHLGGGGHRTHGPATTSTTSTSMSSTSRRGSGSSSHSTGSSNNNNGSRNMLTLPGACLGFCSAHTLVNKERAMRGRSSLVRNVQLDSLCQLHAQHMAQRQELFHSAQSLNDLQDTVLSDKAGENIQRGSSVEEMHEQAMGTTTALSSSIKDSVPQRNKSVSANSSAAKNILGKQFREFGVGTARGSDGKLYMVQLFRGPAKNNGGGQQQQEPKPGRRGLGRRSKSSSRRIRQTNLQDAA